MAAVASATSGANAIIENGRIVNQTTPEQKAEREKQEKATNTGNAQKDQFLQLLVAQMKYQDPMQPTSNTEYISQYATFSSLEQMQNMSATLTMSRANEMAGKNVVIHHKETGGAVQEIEGIVDYVTFENNKAKVFVNGSAYNVEEVYAVMDNAYTQKADLAEQFKEAVDKLPTIPFLTKDNAKTIENLANTFDSLDNSTKALIGEEYVDKLMEYVKACTNAGWIGQTQKENETPATDETKTDESGKVTETGETGDVNEDGGTQTNDSVVPDVNNSGGDNGSVTDEGDGTVQTTGDPVDA